MVEFNGMLASAAASDKDSVRVLLVQDDPIHARLIQLFLNEDPQCKMHLDIATSMAEAVACVGVTSYDALLLDMALPQCANMYAVRVLSAEAVETPVILLTDVLDENQVHEALRVGAHDHLAKDQLSGAELRATVLRASERHKLSMSHEAYDLARRLLQCSNNAVTVLTREAPETGDVPNWRILVGNLHSRRLLTQSNRDIEGCLLHEIVPEPMYVILQGVLDQVMSGGEVRGRKFRLEDQAKWIQVDGTRNATGAALILTDITAIKEREEELDGARLSLQKILDEKTALLSAICEKVPGAVSRVLGRLDAVIGYDGSSLSQSAVQANISGARAEMSALLAEVEGMVSQGPSAGFAYIGANYLTVLEMSPDLTAVVCADDGSIQFLNRVGREILGYMDSDDLSAIPFDAFVPEDYAVLFEDNLMALRAEAARVPMHLIRKDLRLVDVELQVTACPSVGVEEWQGRDMVLISAVDTTRRNRASRRIIAREEQLRKIMDNVADAIVVVDENGTIETLNRSTETVFGASSRELVGTPVGALFGGVSRHPEASGLDVFLKGGEPSRISGWRRHIGVRGNEDEFPIEIAVRDLNLGERHLFIGLIRDVSERVAYEENITYMATHDMLTTLYNRASFREELGKVVSEARENDTRFSLMFFDLDGFKSINNAYGHLVGDRVLSVFANRLTRCLGARARMVARLSADEFVAIVEQTAGAVDLLLLADDASTALQAPVIVDHHDIRVSCCIGIAEFPDAGSNQETLIRSAEYAVRIAKERGRNSIQVYDDALSEKFLHRQRLETAMATALEGDQFQIYYQPKISLSSKEIIGAEALIRWFHPELGMVSPADFIPIAEETGFIRDLGNWVINRVCRDLCSWREDNERLVPIAVNVSAIQFRDVSLVDHLRETLEMSRLAPDLLEIELTESALVEDVDQAVATLRKFNDIGLSIAIDDFGSGYSSFGYLTRFPIDCLKIDQVFVSNIPFNKDDMTVARGIIGMAKSLDLQIVAEGVETQEQAQFLLEQGCDTAQGYLFSRPIPEPDFRQLLADGLPDVSEEPKG